MHSTPFTTLLAISLSISPISALPQQSKRAECACGFRDATTGAVWRESLEADFLNNYSGAISNFSPQTWSTHPAGSDYTMQYTASNVYQAAGQGLQLKTSGYDGSGTIYTAEIDSAKTNFLYGSFRVKASVPKVPGVCFGFFTYQSDTQEIDIEFLSSDDNFAHQVHYTNQPGSTSGATQTVTVSDTDFTSMNVHRFDWEAGKTTFFVNDVQKATIGVNTPTTPSSLLVNVWSAGTSGWTHGPPTADSIATIEYINVYYNSTNLSEDHFEAQCSEAQVDACVI